MTGGLRNCQLAPRPGSQRHILTFMRSCRSRGSVALKWNSGLPDQQMMSLTGNSQRGKAVSRRYNIPLHGLCGEQESSQESVGVMRRFETAPLVWRQIESRCNRPVSHFATLKRLPPGSDRRVYRSKSKLNDSNIQPATCHSSCHIGCTKQKRPRKS